MNTLDSALGATVLTQVRDWLSDPLESRFPYDAVLAAFHETGKEAVSRDLLLLLDEVREQFPRVGGSPVRTSLLRDFLDVALDKYDGRYDYPSYTGLRLLPMPSVDEPDLLAEIALPRRDRLTLQLLADVVRFELDAMDGTERRLPGMRPTPREVDKRLRHALRVAAPARERVLDMEFPHDASVTEQGRWLVDVMGFRLDDHERDALRLSMLPVDTVHDEHLFIRTLQLFETTFSTLAVLLYRVVRDVDDGDAEAAAGGLRSCASLLAESAPLFSMLATMQIEAFRRFRELTSGASAIQSRSYKLVESLCRRPDDERLDSAAYVSVPDVRRRVLEGVLSVDDVVDLSEARGGAAAPGLLDAMDDLATTVQRWRQTHYALAVRNLGQRSGTGYTEGTPYLDVVRGIPVFRARDAGAEGRCPVAGAREVGDV